MSWNFYADYKVAVRFKTSGYSIAGLLLVGLFLVAFLATGAHVVSSSHASAHCTTCIWFQALGGIVAFILSIRLVARGLVKDFCPLFFVIFLLSQRSRAPPLA